MSLKDFVPIEKLGEGSFATVFKVRRLTDQRMYALKKIKMGSLCSKAKDNALNEVRLLASLSSPNIVTYHEAFFQEQHNLLCIVMEWADGGDVLQMINKNKKGATFIKEGEVWKMLLDLISGLEALHEHSILHRDLKCANIFISSGSYKIGDMNVSKVNKNGFAHTQTGTPYYASPQVWKDMPYDEKSDIWSVGCVLYEMAKLHPPFMGKDMEQLYNKILHCEPSKLPSFYSDQLCKLINQCLAKNPADRPTLKELRENRTIKIYENICIDYKQPYEQVKLQLLRTIQMPANRKELKKQLPKANYQTSAHKQPNTQESILSKKQPNVLNDNAIATQNEKSTLIMKQAAPQLVVEPKKPQEQEKGFPSDNKHSVVAPIKAKADFTSVPAKKVAQNTEVKKQSQKSLRKRLVTESIARALLSQAISQNNLKNSASTRNITKKNSYQQIPRKLADRNQGDLNLKERENLTPHRNRIKSMPRTENGEHRRRKAALEQREKRPEDQNQEQSSWSQKKYLGRKRSYQKCQLKRKANSQSMIETSKKAESFLYCKEDSKPRKQKRNIFQTNTPKRYVEVNRAHLPPTPRSYMKPVS